MRGATVILYIPQIKVRFSILGFVGFHAKNILHSLSVELNTTFQNVMNGSRFNSTKRHVNKQISKIMVRF
jgi:hypothetical protein